MNCRLKAEELEKASKILLKRPKPKSSKTHKDIATIVERLFPKEKGFNVRNEYPTIGSHVDIAVFYEGKKHCVIEVEGPSHFYPGTEILNSKTRFKYYLLKQEWPRVISIPAMEFTKYLSEKERFNYVEKVIKSNEMEEPTIKETQGLAVVTITDEKPVEPSPAAAAAKPATFKFSTAAKPFTPSFSTNEKPVTSSFSAGAAPMKQPQVLIYAGVANVAVSNAKELPKPTGF